MQIIISMKLLCGIKSQFLFVKRYPSKKLNSKLNQIQFCFIYNDFRSLAKKSDNHLYMGTTDNCIVEGSLQRKLNLLIWGHRKRLDALAVHPDDMAFVTAGHDKVCALISINRRSRVTSTGDVSYFSYFTKRHFVISKLKYVNFCYF